ncbi:MAG: hypothetical protein JWM47_1498, partial [Acidimicrobiales bacterium]|nr:hypothetical protein [Acidimicrobiales bacterium]
MEGLRPLGVGELLDAAIRIYRSRAKTLMLAVAIPLLPVTVFTTLVTWSSRTDLGVDPSTGAPNFDGGDIALQLTGSLVALVASVVAGALATAACFRSISGAYVGDDPDWKESLRFALSRFWSVLGLTFLVGLATLAGLLVCGFGVLYPLAFFSVAMPALLVEGIGAGEAMRRSRHLVKGRGWRTLGIVLLRTLLASAFQSVVSAPAIALIFAAPDSPVTQVVTAILSCAAAIIVTPFTAAFTMALYVDLRVRKEGFDLVLWAQRLGTAPVDGFPTQPGAPTMPFPPGWGAPHGGYQAGGYQAGGYQAGGYQAGGYAPPGYYGPGGAPVAGGPSRLPPPPPRPG